MPEIWLPDPTVRAERERARFRLHLVRHRTALKNRVHSTLITHGVPNPISDLFGTSGRQLLARRSLPEPWRSTTQASLALIDLLDTEISGIERQLRALGVEHRYIPLLITCPGSAWGLAFTITSELGGISRFPTATKFVGYTGLCPKVDQSGERDRRGPLRENGRNYLRWALVEAAHTIPATSRRSPARPLATAASADGRPPQSRSGASSPKRSGTCSAATNPFAPAGAKQVLTA